MCSSSRPRSHPATRAAPSSTPKAKLIGVAFAIDPVHPNTSFAIADSEVRALVDEFEQSDGAPVDTRGCLVG